MKPVAPSARSSRHRRRMLVRFGLFVLAGAIINVAVAWGCAGLISGLNTKQTSTMVIDSPLLPADSRHWCVTRTERFGCTRIIAMPWGDPIDFQNIVPTESLPPWSDLFERMDNRALDAQASTLPSTWRYRPKVPTGLMDDARGWPWRTMMCSWDLGLTTDPSLPPRQGLVHGIAMIASPPWMPGTFQIDALRALPLQPIWPGFAINTMFYASILWLVFVAPSAVRRRLRLRLGRCPNCAYPVGRSPVCTECGKPVTTQKAQSTKQKAQIT